jgi:TonB family protein
MGRRSVVAAISIFVHAFVLVALMTADVWRPISEWPTPRSAMAFVDEVPRPVHLEDINLPREQRPRASGPATRALATHSIEIAPIASPSGVTNETGTEGPAGVAPNGLAGIETNDNGVGDVGLPSVPPPAPAQAPVRLHSGLRPPQRITNVTPVYPIAARAAHVEGVVIIEATIDAQGNVMQANVLRSIPLLDDAATAAVRRWKFSPTLLNGVAVPIVMTVTVNFTLAP